MGPASTIMSCALLPKIMLDKPQITEKLTNAWHLLNIHYSDTYSEFQKAERMLNQHSYSQSEPWCHIAARLGADENDTLGRDVKNIRRLLTGHLHARGGKGRGWGCVYRNETFRPLLKPFQKQRHLPILHTHKSWDEGAEWCFKERIITFITCKTEEHRGLSRSLPLFLALL